MHFRCAYMFDSCRRRHAAAPTLAFAGTLSAHRKGSARHHTHWPLLCRSATYMHVCISVIQSLHLKLDCAHQDGLALCKVWRGQLMLLKATGKTPRNGQSHNRECVVILQMHPAGSATGRPHLVECNDMVSAYLTWITLWLPASNPTLAAFCLEGRNQTSMQPHILHRTLIRVTRTNTDRLGGQMAIHIPVTTPPQQLSVNSKAWHRAQSTEVLWLGQKVQLVFGIHHDLHLACYTSKS